MRWLLFALSLGLVGVACPQRTLLSWGSNLKGQLGDGAPIFTPVLSPLTSGVTSVDLGVSHGAAVTAEGRLLGWGANNRGQVGRVEAGPFLTPVDPFFTVHTAIDVACGDDFTLALLEDGSVLVYGANDSGQLGLGDRNARNVPTLLPMPGPVVGLAAGGRHSLFLMADGQVMVCGENDSGELGDGLTGDRLSPVTLPAPSDIVQVKAGAAFSLARDAAGRIFAWGANGAGQCTGTEKTVTTPRTVSSTVFRDMDAGQTHVLAVRADGRLVAWGGNARGQLGLGDRTGRNVPTVVDTGGNVILSVACGVDFSLARTASRLVFAWGDNEFSQLGSSRTALVDIFPTAPVLSASATRIAAGGRTALLWQLGRGLAWGLDDVGQRGVGRRSLVAVPGALFHSFLGDSIPPAHRNSIFASPGGEHGLLLTASGRLATFGDNQFSQLGLGGTPESGQRASFPLEILSQRGLVRSGDAGFLHSLLLMADGSVRSFGANGQGALGLGDFSARNVPTEVPGVANALAVSAGGFGGGAHSLVLRSDRTVLAFGANGAGQLGDGTKTNRNTPTPVLNLNTVSQVSAGGLHSLFLLTNGTVFASGSNDSGQIGNDAATSDEPTPVQAAGLLNATGVSAGERHSLAVRGDGTVASWGRAGALGDGSGLADRRAPGGVAGLTNMVQVAAGDGTSFARRADGALFAWGANHLGQLGLGHFDDALSPARVPRLHGLFDVQAGHTTTVATYAPRSAIVFFRPSGDRALFYARTLDGRNLGSTTVGRLGVEFQVVGLGDFTGDLGDDALLLRTTDRRLFVNAVRGTRTVGFVQVGLLGADFDVIGTGDLNDDGHTDILLRRRSDALVTSFLMNRTTITGSRQIGRLPADRTLVGVADADLDGLADLIMQTNATRALAYLKMPPSGTPSQFVGLYTPPAGHSVRGFGDFNADLELDVLLQEDATRATSFQAFRQGQPVGGKVPLFAVAVGTQVMGTFRQP